MSSISVTFNGNANNFSLILHNSGVAEFVNANLRSINISFNTSTYGILVSESAG